MSFIMDLIISWPFGLSAAGIIAYAIYTSYFGDVKGDHVTGINAMIFVQNDLDAKQVLADQKTDSFKRSLLEFAA